MKQLIVIYFLVILKCFAIVKSSKPLELKLSEQKKILFLFRNMLILQTSDLILCYFKTPHLQDTNLTIFISACNYAAKIFKQQRINHLRIKLMSIPIFGLNFRRWQTCPFSTSISFRQLKKNSIGLKWKIQIFFCVVQNY